MVSILAAACPLLPWGLTAIGLAGLCALRIAHTAQRARRDQELGQRLLELLALAVRHGAPLAPAMARAAEDARGQARRRLAAVARALEEGQGLAAALGHGACACFAPHTLAAIAAAQGGPGLGSVLDALGAQADEARALRHRAALAASYPALLAVLLLGLHGLSRRAFGGAPWTFAGQGLDAAVVALVAATLGLWLVLSWGGWRPRGSAWTRALAWGLHRVPWLGARLRLCAWDRVLRACAAQVAAGRTLTEALRAGAPCAGTERLEAELRVAARRLDEGAPLALAFAGASVPALVKGRLLRADLRSAERLAGSLARAAERCRAVARDAVARVQRGLEPASVLAFGLLIAWHFAALLDWMDQARLEAMEAMPW